MSTVYKTTLIEVVKNACGLTAEKSKQAVTTVIEEIAAGLVSGNEVEIRGLFSARVVTNAPCMRRNPKTDEKVEVPAKKRVRIKISRQLKDRVNGL